jgi:hypothetical protein
MTTWALANALSWIAMAMTNSTTTNPALGPMSQKPTVQ